MVNNICNGILKNNIRYLFIKNKCSSTTTLMFSVKVGSKDESNLIRGISHFIEHMLFKGTKSRPDSKAISDDLYKYGAEFNAYTHFETTSYHVKIDSKHIEEALDVLSDMLFNSKLTEKDINVEKKVVISENKKNRSSPMGEINTINYTQIFNKTPYECDIGGFDKDINALTKSKITKYINKFYKSGNILITIAGNYSHSDAKMKTLLTKYFVKPAPRKHRIEKLTITPLEKQFLNIQKTFDYKHRQKKDLSQAYISIGFPGYSWNNSNRYALDIIDTLLCGNMSSRLFIKLREDEGLIYNINCSSDNYSSVGVFSISLGTFGDTKSIMKCLNIVVDELADLIKNKISKKELEGSINYIIGHAKIDLEDSASVASIYSEHILHRADTVKNNKLVYTTDTYIADMRKVTVDDVHNVANELFKYSKCNLAILSKQVVKKSAVTDVVKKLG